MHEVSDLIRQSFPDRSVLIWYNEAAPPISTGKDRFGIVHQYTIPQSLNYISVDIYHMNGREIFFVD